MLFSIQLYIWKSAIDKKFEGTNVFHNRSFILNNGLIITRLESQGL